VKGQLKFTVSRALRLLALLALFCPPAFAQSAPGAAPSETGLASPAPLKPAEVVVVANFAYPYSVDLARHYLALRGIPERQLLVTGMPKTEEISRIDYERTIAGPLKDFLEAEKLDRIRCVVLIYGVPLKVLEPPASLDDRRVELLLREERTARLAELIGLIQAARELGRAAAKAPATPLPGFDAQAAAGRQIRSLMKQMLEELTRAAARCQKVPGGPQRARLGAQWLKLWSEAFGFAAPHRAGIKGMPEPEVPAERKQGYARRIGELLDLPMRPDAAREIIRLARASRGVVGLVDLFDTLFQRVKPDWTWRASVDSELATLFWPPFALAGPRPNPLSIHAQGKNAPRTLMVCRLDGPDETVVRRMIDESVATEKQGLRGNAYIDARGLDGESAYSRCDGDLRRLATLLEVYTKLPTVLDNEPELFQPHSCPEAALYCGWYSLGRYVDAFQFVPGAVGFHVASSEAATLRSKDTTNWCPQLLRHGVAATLGPVEEPYLTAFPPPSEFFGLLLGGRLSLAECYYQTVSHVSWMLTLIGDPLYRPFAAHPALDPDMIPGLLFGASDDSVLQ